MIRIRVSPEPIDVVAEMAVLEHGGAVATFTGLVRADVIAGKGDVAVLELEHYPGATERALERLAQEATARWSLSAASVVHRVGAMRPGERIVFVGTASAHRAPALEACAFLIDRLKTDAPFWKRETIAGETRWVESRSGDDAASARWSFPSIPSPDTAGG